MFTENWSRLLSENVIYSGRWVVWCRWASYSREMHTLAHIYHVAIKRTANWCSFCRSTVKHFLIWINLSVNWHLLENERRNTGYDAVHVHVRCITLIFSHDISLMCHSTKLNIKDAFYLCHLDAQRITSICFLSDLTPAPTI